ncbi:MAG: hypothetical protein JSR58_06395 [Verrucomicrobia bacterium]|nr:hypothetical protein [Verrucomicrobiota bacterium]
MASSADNNIQFARLQVPVNTSSEVLNLACQTKDIDFVNLAIAKKAVPNSETYTWACWTGKIEIVDAVEMLGAKPDEETLTAACNTGNLEVVQRAISKGAFPSDQTLEIAKSTKDDQIIHLVNTLVQGRLKSVPAETNPLETTSAPARLLDDRLTTACKTRKLHLVNQMIEQGALPVKDTLYWACVSGELEIVNAVIKAGAGPDPEGKDSLATKGTLSVACETKNVKIVQAVGKAGVKAGVDTLDVALKTGIVEIVEAVLFNKPKPGPHTLTLACESTEREKVVELILIADGKPDELTFNVACSSNLSADLLHRIVTAGAKVNEKTLTILLPAEDPIVNMPAEDRFKAFSEWVKKIEAMLFAAEQSERNKNPLINDQPLVADEIRQVAFLEKIYYARNVLDRKTKEKSQLCDTMAKLFNTCDLSKYKIDQLIKKIKEKKIVVGQFLSQNSKIEKSEYHTKVDFWFNGINKALNQIDPKLMK